LSSSPHASAHEPRAALPRWLRPRTSEAPGTGRTRLVETTLLVLVGVLLAVATINDLVRQTDVNHRLVADLASWRAYTGHRYHNLFVDQEVFGASSKRDVVCGNTSPGPPKERIQLCLVMTGTVRAGRRTVAGGWYLPPGSEDQSYQRYACFGPAARGLCPRGAPSPSPLPPNRRAAPERCLGGGRSPR
jgi:hypothetical protein